MLARTVAVHRRSDGRTAVDIECPYCERVARAYVWSLAGSGKRCECGARFSGRAIGLIEADRGEDR